MLNEIVEAFIDSGSILQIEFKYPVTPAQISGMTMTTSPNNRTKVSAAQNTATNLAVTFSGAIISETSLTTGGTAPGFLIPQTAPVS